MDYDEAVSFLVKKFVKNPSIFVIYTNALGDFPDILENPIKLSCGDLPHFPSKKKGCISPKLIFGKLNHQYILVLQGRYHHHEGFSMEEVIFPVKIAYFLGCKKILITNAAGSVNNKFELGDIMVVRNHVDLSHPFAENVWKVLSENEKKEKKMYDVNFIDVARKLSVEEGMDKYIRYGLYAMIGTSNFKSSEIKVFRNLGVDAVGTSMVTEIKIAAEFGMEIFAFCVMVDKGIFDYKNYPDPTPEDVSKALEPKKKFIQKLLLKYIRYCDKANVIE
ncbi:hypothetical protein HHI36_021418 [Cryptolaemus montrouzieri]|uniref:purine-nucleoside phosphorylase n=1 Tax=Cryptolaemus montrouzieri TaxID=559131 RepID=A0ABD2MX42_9CUCU